MGPSSAAVGAVISPAIQVTIQEANGSTFPSADSVTLAISTNPGGGTLSGAITVNAVNGVATFSNLRIDKAGTGYRLQASSGTLQTDTSAAFNITGSSPTLAPIADQSSAEGDAVSLATVGQDADGDPLTYSATGLPPGLGIHPTTGVISGTLPYTAAGSYAATVTVSDPAPSSARRSLTWTVSNTDSAPVLAPLGDQTSAEGDTLSLQFDGAGDPDGDAVTWSADGFPPGLTMSAAGLVTGTIPYTAAATYAVLVTVSDPAGHTASRSLTWTVNDTDTTPTLASLADRSDAVGSGIDVQLAGASDLDGDALAWSATGLPSGLSMDAAGRITGTLPTTPGTFTVAVTVSDGTPGGAGGDTAGGSLTWKVDAGTASRLAFVTQPASTAVGGTFGASVRIEDQFGNAITNAAHTIALEIATNPASGTLSGTTSAGAASGVASFGSLSINKAGAGYTLRATCDGMDAAESTAFNITAPVPARMIFSVQPTSTTVGTPFVPAVQVTIRDAFGNTVTDANMPVRLRLRVNTTGAVLYGTRTVNAINGVATFSNVFVTRPGTGYTLAADVRGITSIISGRFNIVKAGPVRLAFVTQPADTPAGAAISPAVQVAVLDALGRPVASAGNAVSLSLYGNAAGAQVLGTSVVSAVNGIATFPDLSISKPGAGYVLRALSSRLSGADSTPFSATAPASVAGLSPQAAASAGRPDLIVAQSSGLAGEGIFQAAPSGEQVVTQMASPSAKAIHRVLVKNAGQTARSFLVRATGADAPGWTVTYQSGSADVTRQMRAGYTTRRLAPGESEVVSITMAPDSLVGEGDICTATLEASLDAQDTGVRDAVQVTAEAAGK